MTDPKKTAADEAWIAFDSLAHEEHEWGSLAPMRALRAAVRLEIAEAKLGECPRCAPPVALQHEPAPAPAEARQPPERITAHWHPDRTKACGNPVGHDGVAWIDYGDGIRYEWVRSDLFDTEKRRADSAESSLAEVRSACDELRGKWLAACDRLGDARREVEKLQRDMQVCDRCGEDLGDDRAQLEATLQRVVAERAAAVAKLAEAERRGEVKALLRAMSESDKSPFAGVVAKSWLMTEIDRLESAGREGGER